MAITLTDSAAERVRSYLEKRGSGIGLRLGSSRSAQGGMVHIDIAYPLSGDSDEIQFLIRSRETF